MNPRHISSSLALRIASATLIFATALAAAPDALALDAAHYAASSRLAQGNWVKIKIEEEGMQFISTATLRNLGFSDPTKVRVYGLGGRPLPATLTAANADDLPIVASTANSRGLYFYGYGSVDWTMSAPKSTLTLTHNLHPYDEESYYLL
ncbi:MAG: hypothetical protein K2I48_06185 [Muribaculaceae bacterium]|nr:hypothetical protein [Muribaculaceae bacterium]